MSDVLKIETVGEVQYVSLNRPERLNALNQQVAVDLLAYFEGLRRNEAIRVVVLRAEGRAFCSGADLKATPAEALKEGAKGDWTLSDVMKAMRDCPQPIVCLVQGAAAGGGMAIALSADIIVCADDAVFHPAFMKIGLSGAELGVSWRMQRSMGAARAREVLFTSRPVPAAEAVATGMASVLVPRAELDEKGKAIAESMLIAGPDALRVTKRTVDATLEASSFNAAMEIEERGQMLMINRRARAAQSA